MTVGVWGGGGPGARDLRGGAEGARGGLGPELDGGGRGTGWVKQTDFLSVERLVLFFCVGRIRARGRQRLGDSSIRQVGEAAGFCAKAEPTGCALR